jgi:hypothetical protein
MLAARRRDGGPATSADCVATPSPIAVTGGDTAAMATAMAATMPAAATDVSCSTGDASPTTVTTSGSGTAPSSSAPSCAAAAPTFGQRGTYRQSSDCESEHEHSE